MNSIMNLSLVLLICMGMFLAVFGQPRNKQEGTGSGLASTSASASRTVLEIYEGSPNADVVQYKNSSLMFELMLNRWAKAPRTDRRDNPFDALVDIVYESRLKGRIKSNEDLKGFFQFLLDHIKNDYKDKSQSPLTDRFQIFISKSANRRDMRYLLMEMDNQLYVQSHHACGAQYIEYILGLADYSFDLGLRVGSAITAGITPHVALYRDMASYNIFYDYLLTLIDNHVRACFNNIQFIYHEYKSSNRELEHTLIRYIQEKAKESGKKLTTDAIIDSLKDAKSLSDLGAKPSLEGKKLCHHLTVKVDPIINIFHLAAIFVPELVKDDGRKRYENEQDFMLINDLNRICEEELKDVGEYDRKATVHKSPRYNWMLPPDKLEPEYFTPSELRRISWDDYKIRLKNNQNTFKNRHLARSAGEHDEELLRQIHAKTIAKEKKYQKSINKRN